MSYRNLLLLLAAAVVSYACYVRAEQNPYARHVAAGFSVIDSWSLEEAPDDELFNGAMHGMVSVLHKHGDQHTEFVDAKQQAAFSEDYEQQFGGVGIRLRLLGEPPLPTVIGLPERGTPAAAADIRLSDRVEAVDGVATAGRDLEEVTSMVRGPVGSPVTLSIQRPAAAAPHVVRIERPSSTSSRCWATCETPTAVGTSCSATIHGSVTCAFACSATRRPPSWRPRSPS